MKRILLIMLLVGLMAMPCLAQNKNIYARPNSRWLEGSFVDPLWNWLKWADPLVASSGSNPGVGSILYVDSNVTNAGNGSTWLNAVATLDAAVNLASANDTIYLAQGHTETMGVAANEVDVDVDGLTIKQIGNNTVSNGFDYTDDEATGAFTIDADNITLVNLRFHANVPDVNDAVELKANATGVSFIGCLFDTETPGTDEFFRSIKQDGANANQLTIQGCEFRMGAGAAECAIDLIDSDYSSIIGNKITGDYSVTDVNNATTACIWLTIAGNEMVNGTVGGAAGLNAQPVIELKSDTSAMIYGNVFACNVATPDAAVVGADTYLFSNVYNEAEGGVSAAPMWFTTDTLDNKIGVDDAANLGTTANVTADADGTILERLEQLDVDTSARVSSGEATAATVLTTILNGNNNIFTISGTVKIIEIVGIVTTEIEGKACEINYNMDPTSPAGDTVFGTDGTALEINGDTVGALYTWDGVIANDLTATDNGVALGMPAPTLIVPAGSLELAAVVSTSATGAITFTVRYKPLTPGATITSNSS